MQHLWACFASNNKYPAIYFAYSNCKSFCWDRLGYSKVNYVNAFREFELEFCITAERRANLERILERSTVMPVQEKEKAHSSIHA
jgi:hypothetical protein